MTKITFERSGGLMGQEISLDLDLDTIPPDEAQNITQLLQRANFFKLPSNLVSRSTPDEFQYQITVDSGTLHHTVHTCDTSAPAALRPLLNLLSALARVS